MSLFVGNVASRTDPRELEGLFRRFGECRLDLKRGFAFVDYASPHDAAAAKRDLHGSPVAGARIVVEWSRRSAKNPPPLPTPSNHQVRGRGVSQYSRGDTAPTSARRAGPFQTTRRRRTRDNSYDSYDNRRRSSRPSSRSRNIRSHSRSHSRSPRPPRSRKRNRDYDSDESSGASYDRRVSYRRRRRTSYDSYRGRSLTPPPRRSASQSPRRHRRKYSPRREEDSPPRRRDRHSPLRRRDRHSPLRRRDSPSPPRRRNGMSPTRDRDGFSPPGPRRGFSPLRRESSPRRGESRSPSRSSDDRHRPQESSVQPLAQSPSAQADPVDKRGHLGGDKFMEDTDAGDPRLDGPEPSGTSVAQDEGIASKENGSLSPIAESIHDAAPATDSHNPKEAPFSTTGNHPHHSELNMSVAQENTRDSEAGDSVEAMDLESKLKPPLPNDTQEIVNPVSKTAALSLANRVSEDLNEEQNVASFELTDGKHEPVPRQANNAEQIEEDVPIEQADIESKSKVELGPIQSDSEAAIRESKPEVVPAKDEQDHEKERAVTEIEVSIPEHTPTTDQQDQGKEEIKTEPVPIKDQQGQEKEQAKTESSLMKDEKDELTKHGSGPASDAVGNGKEEESPPTVSKLYEVTDREADSAKPEDGGAILVTLKQEGTAGPSAAVSLETADEIKDEGMSADMPDTKPAAGSDGPEMNIAVVEGKEILTSPNASIKIGEDETSIAADDIDAGNKYVSRVADEGDGMAEKIEPVASEGTAMDPLKGVDLSTLTVKVLKQALIERGFEDVVKLKLKRQCVEQLGLILAEK